jgi:hypothetical protein
MLSEDNNQRFKSIVSILSNGYKVLMAALLCIFVPQKCPESPTNECSINDNFTNLIPYNVVVMVVNFITLATFVYFYSIEYYRENWCIEYLDIDETKPMTNLKTEIESYPEFKQELVRINYIYYISSCVLWGLNIVNFVMSSVLVYHFYYLDFKSISVMITYFLLVSDKLSTTLATSKKSYTEIMPNSAYMSGPIVFNIIDRDYVKTVKIKEVEVEMEVPKSI